MEGEADVQSVSELFQKSSSTWLSEFLFMAEDVPQLQKEQAASKQDPKKLIGASYECIKKILELDTQSTIIDMNMMESINNAAILKYRDVESYVDSIEKDAAVVHDSQLQLAQAGGKLSVLECRVAKLERLVNELDEWSSELEVKVRRRRRSSSHH